MYLKKVIVHLWQRLARTKVVHLNVVCRRNLHLLTASVNLAL